MGFVPSVFASPDPDKIHSGVSCERLLEGAGKLDGLGVGSLVEVLQRLVYVRAEGHSTVAQDQNMLNTAAVRTTLYCHSLL